MDRKAVVDIDIKCLELLLIQFLEVYLSLVLGSSCTEQQKKENAHSGDRDSDWCMF
jgi:hypothetical protein